MREDLCELMDKLVPQGSESVTQYKQRVVDELNKRYRAGIEMCQLVLPREIKYSINDTQSIETFRKSLLLNKVKHHTYNPSFDHIFGRLLYRGLIDEAEKII
jgi:hypothetical protein